MLQDRRHIPAGHVRCHRLNLCLGSLQTHPEALESVFALALTDMNDPPCSQIEHQGNVLAFLAEIHLIDSDMTNFLEVERFVFPAQMLFVNLLDRVPT